jgi:hypothetical protein
MKRLRAQQRRAFEDLSAGGDTGRPGFGGSRAQSDRRWRRSACARSSSARLKS